MTSIENYVLCINGGSSSIKFASYVMEEPMRAILKGEIERIGTGNALLGFTNILTNQTGSIKINAADYHHAANFLIDWLEKQDGFVSVKAIGHRLVHGMQHTEPEMVTDELLAELKKISAFDPEHLPEEISLIEIFRKRYPQLPQIACFDTAFHAGMPPVAKLLPIPRCYQTMGIRRYGFHGLSYAYLMEELEHVAGVEAAKGRVILAHLGSGASMAAVKDGKCIDTSMGFSPTSGLPMGTRTGDLDPGVAWYLMKNEKLSARQFSKLINHQSGLLGVSETSADIRDLLQSEKTDSRAAEAIELFCYQARKWIGAYAAVLGGLDTLVFSGGIGENAVQIRKRICKDLQFLGIEMDENKNRDNESIISSASATVYVRVIRTNEEQMIAKLVSRKLNHISNN